MSQAHELSSCWTTNEVTSMLDDAPSDEDGGTDCTAQAPSKLTENNAAKTIFMVSPFTWVEPIRHGGTNRTGCLGLTRN
jgi:hypothetical protein